MEDRPLVIFVITNEFEAFVLARSEELDNVFQDTTGPCVMSEHFLTLLDAIEGYTGRNIEKFEAGKLYTAFFYVEEDSQIKDDLTDLGYKDNELMVDLVDYKPYQLFIEETTVDQLIQMELIKNEQT